MKISLFEAVFLQIVGSDVGGKKLLQKQIHVGITNLKHVCANITNFSADVKSLFFLADGVSSSLTLSIIS